MDVVTIPTLAKLSHVRSVLVKMRKLAKRSDSSEISKALDFLDDIQKELRK